MARLVDKYRPKKWDDIVNQEDIVKSIRSNVARGDVPHYLFIGQSGVGKTSIAEVLANDLDIHFHEFNASDTRGIGIVREDIKRLAEYKGQRIIFLDEADQMTPEAQHALRRIMEKTEESIFILTGNDEWKLIEAIKSRCVIHRFVPIPDIEVRNYVTKVIKAEGIKLDLSTDEKRQRVRDGIMSLVMNARGDLRAALNDLEKIVDEGKMITPESVASLIKPNNMIAAVQAALDGSFEAAKAMVEKEYIEGNFNPRIVFRNLYDALPVIKDREVMIRLYGKLGEIEANSKRGCDPVIQLISFLSYCWGVPHLSKCPVLRGDK